MLDERVVDELLLQEEVLALLLLVSKDFYVLFDIHELQVLHLLLSFVLRLDRVQDFLPRFHA